MTIEMKLYSEEALHIFQTTSDEELEEMLDIHLQEMWELSDEDEEQYEARILSLIEESLENRKNDRDTVGYNGLSDAESEVIALAVRNGFRSGVLDGLTWEINIETEEHDELLHIVQLLEDGFTSGYEPTWQLTFNRK